MFRSFLALATAATFAHAASQDYDGATCMNKNPDTFISQHYSGMSDVTPEQMAELLKASRDGQEIHTSKFCSEPVESDISYVGARAKCEWECSTTDKYVEGEKLTSDNMFGASEVDTDIAFAVFGCQSSGEGMGELNKYPLKGECSHRVGFNDDGTRSESGTMHASLGFAALCLKHPDHGKSGDDDAVCDFKCSKAQCTISYGFFDAFSDGELGGLIVGVCFWLACIYAVPKWARMRNPDASKIKWGLLGGCCGIFAFACVPCFAKKKKADPNSTEMQATA